MTGSLLRRDLPGPEVELLDAEVFEAPRRLGRWDLRAQTGAPSEPCPFNDPDPEDDR